MPAKSTLDSFYFLCQRANRLLVRVTGIRYPQIQIFRCFYRILPYTNDYYQPFLEQVSIEQIQEFLMDDNIYPLYNPQVVLRYFEHRIFRGLDIHIFSSADPVPAADIRQKSLFRPLCRSSCQISYSSEPLWDLHFILPQDFGINRHTNLVKHCVRPFG